MIKAIPNHCIPKTSSFKRKKAIITETGNSNEETILPNPIPVCGNPAFIKSGGIIVPKRDSMTPHFMKILKLKGVDCVTIAKANTMTAPPNSMYKLRCAEEMPTATRFAVNIVVVNEAAARRPNTIPRQSNSISVCSRFVAKIVPITTMITEIIF